jgi:RNA polymerase sigma-70 factor (ECF subfamily)
MKGTAHTATAEAVPRVSDGDLELLRSVAQGDGAAFGRLAERLGPMLRAVLYRLGLTEAEVDDALQETLIRIWASASGFPLQIGRPTFVGPFSSATVSGMADMSVREQSSVTTWAYRIAVNQGLGVLRSRRNTQPLDGLPAAEPMVTWESREQARVIRDAVLGLPVPLRTVVILREYQDLSYRSIADVLEIPIGTVMSRLHEGRARLRRRLAQQL